MVYSVQIVLHSWEFSSISAKPVINISPRASERFNHVTEAKRFEDVFLRKKYAKFKNQTRKILELVAESRAYLKMHYQTYIWFNIYYLINPPRM